MNKTIRFCIAQIIALACVSFVLATPVGAQTGDRVWNFDHDTTGKPPQGLTSALTGQGMIGEWTVMKDATAPSQPNVIAVKSMAVKNRTIFIICLLLLLHLHQHAKTRKVELANQNFHLGG